MVARATMNGLQKLLSPESFALKRGKNKEDLWQ
jgi:ribosomal protein S5